MPLLATATIEHTNGLAEDAVQNGFAIQTGAASLGSSEYADIVTAIIAFYSSTPSGFLRNGTTPVPAPIGNYLSNSLSRAGDGITVNIYDLTGKLDGSPHGSPIYTGTGALYAAGGGNPMPSEVALCVTLEALGRTTAQVEVGATRPKSRYTGRLYLGPVIQGASDTSGRPTAGFQDTAINAVKDLDDDLRAIDPDLDLGVWSRADSRLTAVEYVSVDDAWDTQRRRGVAPTARRRVALAEA